MKLRTLASQVPPKRRRRTRKRRRRVALAGTVVKLLRMVVLRRPRLQAPLMALPLARAMAVQARMKTTRAPQQKPKRRRRRRSLEPRVRV